LNIKPLAVVIAHQRLQVIPVAFIQTCCGLQRTILKRIGVVQPFAKKARPFVLSWRNWYKRLGLCYQDPTIAFSFIPLEVAKSALGGKAFFGSFSFTLALVS
jgi:hypothetical protein